jgi:hypothetical protein
MTEWQRKACTRFVLRPSDKTNVSPSKKIGNKMGTHLGMDLHGDIAQVLVQAAGIRLDLRADLSRVVRLLPELGSIDASTNTQIDKKTMIMGADVSHPPQQDDGLRRRRWTHTLPSCRRMEGSHLTLSPEVAAIVTAIEGGIVVLLRV